MKELLILFYLLYGLEWLVKVPINGFNLHKAYRNISFEREAYSNEKNPNYLLERKHYNWIKRIFK